MQVMVLVKARKESEAGVMPSKQFSKDIGYRNEQPVKTGIMGRRVK